MKRYSHNLSFRNFTSGDFTEVIPVGVVDVLPGDTFRYMPSALLRLQPLDVPVFADLQVAMYCFFVPNRS